MNIEILDVSIGHIDFKPKNNNFFRIIPESESYGWEDVQAFGYPDYLIEDVPHKGLFLKG